MGDSHNDTVRVDFDRKIKLDFHGAAVTSDAGLLAYRELDDALGLTSAAATGLHDTRTGQNTQHNLLALLRQSIYSRLAGCEDVNDAERLCGEASGAPGSGCDGAATGGAFFRESRCNRSFGGVGSPSTFAAETPGGVHLGKIGSD